MPGWTDAEIKELRAFCRQIVGEYAERECWRSARDRTREKESASNGEKDNGIPANERSSVHVRRRVAQRLPVDRRGEATPTENRMDIPIRPGGSREVQNGAAQRHQGTGLGKEEEPMTNGKITSVEWTSDENGEQITISADEYDPFFFDNHDVVFVMDDGTRWKVVSEGIEKGLGASEPVRVRLVQIDSDDDSTLTIPGGKVFAGSMKGKPRKGAISHVGKDFIAEMGALAISAENARVLESAIGANKSFMQLNDLAMTSGYKYAQDRVCRVETTVSEMLEQRGIDPKNKKARAKLRKDIKALGDEIRWTFQTDKGDFITIPLAGGAYAVKGEQVSFAFSAEYMAMIANRAAGRIPTPKELLTTDEKNNPNATSIGFKLCMHTYQNKGKTNENTLSVAKLLEYVNGIPTHDEVMVTDRHYTTRIIKPLERDLNHLVKIGVIEYWDYCHTNGEPLTAEEQAARFDGNGNECVLPYEIAIVCNIQWRLAEEHPEHMKRVLESREQKRIDAEAAKQRNAERQKRIERRKETEIAKAAAKNETAKQ